MFTTSVENPEEIINSSLVIGAVLFGVGWGLGGICPGPFYAMVPMTNMKMAVYWGVPYIFGLKFGTFVEYLL